MNVHPTVGGWLDVGLVDMNVHPTVGGWLDVRPVDMNVHRWWLIGRWAGGHECPPYAIVF